jgi:ABC-type transporter Mla MlaB component
MNFDLLLRWLSYKRIGSWTSFRSAIQTLGGMERADKLDYIARLRLSNFAFVDFIDTYKSGTLHQQWSIRPAALAGLCDDRFVILTGFRTDNLISQIDSACLACDCELTILTQRGAPTEYRIKGDSEKFTVLAELLNIDYIPRFSLKELALAPPIETWKNQDCEEPPTNWPVWSFSFTKWSWIEGNADEIVVEFRSKSLSHLRKTMLKIDENRFIPTDRFSAIYAGANARDLQMLDWDASNKLLSAPLAARLPDQFERAVCMSGGTMPYVRDGRRMYETVSDEVARAVAVATGQFIPHPQEILIN